MSQFVSAAKVGEIPDGGGKCIEVEGRRIAVFHMGGEYFAIDDACTHHEAPLSEGSISGEEVVCPWHGATFELRTGKCTGLPARKDVSRYNVRVQGDQVEVEV